MFRSSRKVTIAKAGESTGFITRSATPILSSSDKPTNAGVVFSRATRSVMDKPEPVVPHTPVEDSGPNVETAASSSGGLPSSTQVNEVIVAQIMSGVLEQIIDQNTLNGVNRTINRIYADMYYHDSICGSAVDLWSSLPFSDFSLTGIKDPKILQRFQDSLESMNMGALLPSLSIDYLVMGGFLGSMSWDEETKRFNGITPHNMDFAEIFPVPIFGEDPLINISIPPEVLRTMRIDDPRLKDIKNRIPDDIKGFLTGTSKSGGKTSSIPLDPSSTIFIPRRALLRDYAGVSLFKRALPAWFVEKALIRGTIDQAYKRQRSALHITAGDGVNWTPTKDQMAEIANLFLNIDLDPVGALIVTRNDVNVNEVRRGDDFYKWSDAYDSLSSIKFRAIGVSEAFITGDANFSTMEKTLSVMLENIKNYRGLITQEVFYKKMFPAIAKENDIKRKRYSSEEIASIESDPNWVNPNWKKDSDGMYTAEIGAAPSVTNFDYNNYVIPRVQWHKQLLPEADDAYMQLLDALSQKGIPIPLRIMAAAGGLKLDTIYDGMETDIRDRERLKKYSDRIKEFAPKPAEGEEDGGFGEEASVNLTDLGPSIVGRGGSLVPRGIGTRGPAEEHLVSVSNTRNGKPVYTTPKGRAVLTERLHKKVAAEAAELARKQNADRPMGSGKSFSYGKTDHGKEND